MVSRTPEELAWAAGLFEGEGTVTIAVRNSDETYRLVVIIGNTDQEIIDFFGERWPGWVQPFYGSRPGRKPGSSWTISGPRAEAFLGEILPYVRSSRVRQKIDVALRFRAAQSRRKLVWTKAGYKATQRALYEEMRELNRRGVREVEE